jgi:hypothetical protein
MTAGRLKRPVDQQQETEATDQTRAVLIPTGVAMNKVVRAWMRVLVCRARTARRDAGMVTSEYAMGIVAAVAFAVILYKVVTSGEVTAELQGIVKRALDAGV